MKKIFLSLFFALSFGMGLNALAECYRSYHTSQGLVTIPVPCSPVGTPPGSEAGNIYYITYYTDATHRYQAGSESFNTCSNARTFNGVQTSYFTIVSILIPDCDNGPNPML